MTLVLEHVGGGDRRIVQAGHPFRLGTFPDATWSLPPGGDGAKGAGEVRIAAETAGASVTLLRGAAYLDQRPLVAGEARALPDGAIIAVGMHRIAARYRSDLTAARASEAPTISTILADVSPGGITAESPVEARSDDDWISGLTGELRAEQRPDWDSLGRFDNRAEVTREGEYSNDLNALKSANTFLPDDWDAEPDIPGPSDAAARAVQSRAPGDVMPLPTGHAELGDAETSQRIGDDGLAFLRGAGLSASEMADVTPETMQSLGNLLRIALDGVTEMERAQALRAADLDLPARVTAPRDAVHTLLAAVQAGQGACADLSARLVELARAQSAMHEGALAFVSAARERLDPVVLWAVATPARRSLRLGTAARAWSLYAARFEGRADTAPEDASPETAPPLSDRALATAIRSQYDASDRSAAKATGRQVAAHASPHPLDRKEGTFGEN
ncbi:hypothetical protein KUV51_02960 [Tateyamaria omphalii]|uniref:type VI secretion system-associated FHA domain protein n=1 Tax=Tateyamaria omphalii TaxID=299262 RepID=UPI001C993CD6|nr:type VI secretion system-associated FHA domain protein [Tateyamaria omphalii]MBY5931950.1 hypothetical protein [Tateyamaria omphalii]